MEPFNREGTVFNPELEPDKIVQLDFRASELPSKKELEVRKFRAAVEDAFKIVQHARVDNKHEVLAPINPLELARVNSRLVARMRREYLEASLFGEVNNDNVVSFDDARARRYNDRREEAA